MNTVIDSIYTVFEREKVLNFLDQFEQNAFNPQIDVKTYISSQLSSIFEESVINSISSALTVGSTGSDGIVSKIKILREELKSMPVVSMTLPFRPDQNYSTLIGKRVRETAGKPVLTGFALDPKLLGGAVVEHDGRVGEYSFRRYFEMMKEHI